MTMPVIDVMTFDEDARITSQRAFVDFSMIRPGADRPGPNGVLPVPAADWSYVRRMTSFEERRGEGNLLALFLAGSSPWRGQGWVHGPRWGGGGRRLWC